jgi:hypothetical protein
MKRIVFFFVNPAQISKLSGSKINNESLPDINKYIVFSNNNNKKKIDKLSTFNPTEFGDEIVIVVNDGYDVNRIVNSITEYLQTNSCFVYSVFHKTVENAGTISEEFLKQFGTNYKSYINEHEVGGSIFDLYLIPLILDFNSKLFNGLIAKLPDMVLEAKLILLHECLVPSSIPKELPAVLSTSPKGDVYMSAYRKFLIDCEGMTDRNVFDTDFIDALTKLRISLLGS